jgi:FlaA1/EpsC-like NDP-sugar epimerase
VRVLTFPTSIRGRRDPNGRLPLVRWDVPDVRECRVLLFGAGAAGEQMLHFLEMMAPGRVVGVVDNDPSKAGLTLGRFQVQAFAAVPREAYDVVVIASLPGRQPISAQLTAAGLTANRDFVAADRVQQWYDLVRQYEAEAA